MQNFNSPLEAFLYWEVEAPNNIFFKQPIDGKIITFTFKEVGKEARKIASKLKGMVCHKGRISHYCLKTVRIGLLPT